MPAERSTGMDTCHVHSDRTCGQIVQTSWPFDAVLLCVVCVQVRR